MNRAQNLLIPFGRYFRSRLSGTDWKDAHKDFYLKNIQNISTAIILLIPISLILFIVFALKTETSNQNEMNWRNGIMLSHLISVTILSILYFLIGSKSKKPINTSFSIFISHFSFIIILTMGVIVTGIDQLVTNSINPFFLVCLFIPLIITLQPKHSLLYYFIAILEFVIIVPIFQHDRNILLSNFVNSLSAAGFGMALSYSLWLMNISKYKQSQIISKQTIELEKQNQQLTILSEDLKKINTSKDKFFSILAHDLRSPITGFLGLSGIIAEDISSFSTQQLQEMVNSMKTSALNIFNLLNNLLEWSRMQQGQMQFNPTKVEINQLLYESIETHKQVLEEKSISIQFQPNQRIEIIADKQMMSSAIRNLLSNAIKFSSNKSMISINSNYEQVDKVSIVIQDYGIGMNPEVVNSLFKLSESINRKGTAGEPSTGLGLILCKEFIEMHHGTLSVQSQENKGSRFTVTVPIYQTQKAQ